MKRHTLCTTLSTGALAASLAMFAVTGTAHAQATPQAESDVSNGLSGDIVVTARKREESLLEVPLAITAMTSQDIEKRGITSVNDFVNNVPGINVSNVNSGRNDRSFQQISLRGMTPSTTTSTLTASFIDGVPVASATALNAVIDPARIELLRGPQNAYFGRNAFAGAMNVVTRSPGNDFGGSITAMGGTRSNMDVSAALEGPILADLLSFRITGRAFSRDGSYVNGANPNQTLGDQETRTGTLQLELTPSSGLKIRAMGMYSEDDDGPSAQGMLSAFEVRANNGVVNIPFRTGNTNGTVILPSVANCTLGLAGAPFICGAAPGLPVGFSPSQNTVEDALLGRILADGSERVVSPQNGVQGYGLVRQYYHLHLNVDYELGDTGFTLSSLTGYNNESYSQLADLDNYDTSLLRNPAANATNGLRTSWSFPFLVERKNRDFSQELRVAYDKGGAIQAMLGASYLRTESESDLVSVFAAEQFGSPRSNISIQAPQKAETIGIFGNLSYEVTDALTVNFEGRWQRDEIFGFSRGTTTIGAAAAAELGIAPATFAPRTQIFSKRFENFLPRIIVNYDIAPDVMVYASWSKAANVSLGSFNTNATLGGSAGELAAAAAIGLGVIVEPETLTNYEVGFKGRFLDGRLIVTAAAYLADWKNQHNTRSVTFLDTMRPIPLPTIVAGVAGTGDTRLKGFELDVVAEPLDGFTINASGAINDSDVQTFADPAVERRTGVTGAGFIGNQLPLSSKYSANIGAQYTGEFSEDRTWFVRADFSYKSRQFVDPANITWINGRTQVNARMGVTLGQFSLEGFATNLFNNRQYTAIAQNNVLEPSFFLSNQPFGYLNVGLPELQTFGIRGSYRF